MLVDDLMVVLHALTATEGLRPRDGGDVRRHTSCGLAKDLDTSLIFPLELLLHLGGEGTARLGGMSSYIPTISGSESLSGSECMKHYHEVIDKHSRNEYCFSRIPLVECGDICHPAGMREKRVSFACMSKSDRRTMHILEKIRAGKV